MAQSKIIFQISTVEKKLCVSDEEIAHQVDFLNKITSRTDPSSNSTWDVKVCSKKIGEIEIYPSFGDLDLAKFVFNMKDIEKSVKIRVSNYETKGMCLHLSFEETGGRVVHYSIFQKSNS